MRYKNRYWLNADPRNSEDVFQGVVRWFLTGKPVSETAGLFNLSRPSISNSFRHIGNRLRDWNFQRVSQFKRNEGIGNASYESAFKTYCSIWWGYVATGKCLAKKCMQCVGSSRTPEVTFLRKATNEARGIQGERFEWYCSLAIARSTYLRAHRKAESVFCESITDALQQVLLDSFSQFPIGGQAYDPLPIDAFGPIGTFHEELNRILALMTPEDRQDLIDHRFL